MEIPVKKYHVSPADERVEAADNGSTSREFPLHAVKYQFL
jgi:hypothetical protein